MANETIELAKNWEPRRMSWPALASEKLDGVPVRLRRGQQPVTRQGEPCVSIEHINSFFQQHFDFAPGVELVGELYIRGLPFKEISGKARSTKAQAPDLVLYVFDLYANYEQEVYQTAPYKQRIEIAKIALEDIAGKLGSAPDELPIQIIPWVEVEDEEAALRFADLIQTANPKAEGVMIHAADKPFQPGKRCWGTQRIKPEPTYDIEITGFQEAVSELGEPLGMVGRMNAKYYLVDGSGKIYGTTSGVGPGRLTHAERKALWELYSRGQWKPQIAEVKAMRDDTYQALRQPTFQRWRPDKRKADTIS